MMSTPLANIQTPHQTSNSGRKPSSLSGALEERTSTKHRLSSIFTRRSSDNSSTTSSSSSDSLHDARILSDAKSISSGTYRSRTTSPGAAKSSSTSSSNGSAKKGKRSTTSREEGSSSRRHQHSSNVCPNPWVFAM